MSGSSSPGLDLAARAATLPKARHGYARGPVDAFADDAQRAVESLHGDNAGLTGEVRHLREQLAALEAKYERLRTAELDERAQDIVTVAEEQAAEIVAQGERAAAEIVRQARREAEVALERSRQELAWGRRQLAALRARFSAEQQAQPSGPPASSAADPAPDPAADENSSTPSPLRPEQEPTRHPA